MIPRKIILFCNLQQNYPHRRHPRHPSPPLWVTLPWTAPNTHLHATPRHTTPHLCPNFAFKVAIAAIEYVVMRKLRWLD